jgi:medium-chain acyl-[acyl-carrier-protein] hydrolase
MVSAAWFPYLKPNPSAKVRLLCLPHAGGGASRYRSWARRLPSVEVWAVQPPGRESRLSEPAFTRMEPLVEALLAATTEARAVPYALFGHSLGAAVAFELARAVRRAGAPAPVALFASGRGAPDVVEGEPIHALPEPEFIRQICALNGTQPEVFEEPELKALILPLLRSDLELHETYRCQEEAPLGCRLVALGGAADPSVPPDQLAGWARHTQDFGGVRVFPGDHFFVQSAEAAVLQEVERALSTARSV